MLQKDFTKFNKQKRVKLLLGIITVVLIAFMFPTGESLESEITEGTIWTNEDLIASFSFPIVKDPNVYKAEIAAATHNVYSVYLRVPNVAEESLDSLKSYNKHLLNLIDSLNASSVDYNYNPSGLSLPKFRTLRHVKWNENQTGKSGDLKNLLEQSEMIASKIYREESVDFIPLNHIDTISVRVEKEDVYDVIDNYTTFEDIRKKVLSEVSELEFQVDEKEAIIEIINKFLHPHLIYREDLRKEEVKQAENSVSKFSGIVNENERIIGKHERVTKDAKLKIDSYKIAKGDKIGNEGVILQFLGKIIHIAFLIALLVIYLYSFRKHIYKNNSKLLLFSINIVFMAFLTFLINSINIKAPIQYLIFIPASSMILTVMFDSRVGFYSTVIIVLICGALRGNDYSFAAANLFAGALAVYTVRDIKNRNQIFRSLGYILLGYIVTLTAFGLERFESFRSLLTEFAFAGTNSLISPVLSYGLLIFFERIFRITTDLTLVELSNFDRPVLRELARRAPGTFNHSITMGTLAEAAAEQCGANPLLARVGAYYHDIGKLSMPQNFVENQLNNSNIHENLNPLESVALIKRHVAEGIALSKEHNIPQEIIDFIPMHHGTTVMTFFHEKAKQIFGEENINVEDYRYPGPKPTSKETAIIMLADGCESAVRSIDNPDSTKIENLINKIIKNRIEDGQLDDSSITFNDVKKIKETFINILLGQHHKRIRYPKQDEIEQGSSQVISENDPIS